MAEVQQGGVQALANLSYRDLQRQCRQHGLSARGSTAVLRQRIQDYRDGNQAQNQAQAQVQDAPNYRSEDSDAGSEDLQDIYNDESEGDPFRKFEEKDTFKMAKEIIDYFPDMTLPWEKELDKKKKEECMEFWPWPEQLPEKIPFINAAWKSGVDSATVKKENELATAQQAVYESFAPLLWLIQWLWKNHRASSRIWGAAAQDTIALLMNGLTKVTHLRRRMVLPSAKISEISKDLAKLRGSQDSLFSEDHTKTIRTQKSVRRDIKYTKLSTNFKRNQNRSKKFKRFPKKNFQKTKSPKKEVNEK